MSQDKEREYGGLTEQQVDEIWQRTGRLGDMQSFAKALIRATLATQPPAVQGEPARPDILERLSYHALERDDLTLDECLDYLAKGWAKVHGRTERQMVMQILALLAGKAASPPSREVEPLTPESWEEIEAVIACLGDDAAQLREENAEDERAANMDRAADLLAFAYGIHSRGEGEKA